jgi:hypothetical protein
MAIRQTAIVASAAGLAPARTRLKGEALDYFAFADYLI